MNMMRTIDWTHVRQERRLAVMSTPHVDVRRAVGEHLAPLELSSLAHGTIHVPGPKFTHLQFRRFAGCPVCNLHLRSFARGHQ